MIPLMPTIALVFASLCCSAFVILRILLSILPRRYLGRRVYPLTFDEPSTHYLPPADKSYVWLALCDVLSVSLFVWEAFSQWVDSTSGTGASATAFRAGSAARLWLALTFRQTCFFVVSALIVIHVRRRKSVSFGRVHWFLWVPLTLLASVSTIVVVLLVGASRQRFLVGYIAYSSTIAVLNTAMFGTLVGSLIVIKRSLAHFNQVTASKVSKSFRETVEKSQVSLAAEDIDAVREGSSWITSPASSRHRRSGSLYSHSTTRTSATRNLATSPERERATALPFPIRPSPGTHTPSLPRTPPSRRRGSYAKNDFGLVRRRTQSLRAAVTTAAALTSSSQGSWIASSFGTRPTHSAWSYPSTPRSSSRNRTQSTSRVPSAIASTPTQDMSLSSARSGVAGRVVGGRVRATVSASNGQYAPSTLQAERGTASNGASSRSSQIEVSTLRIIAWLAGVWVPLVLSLLYLTNLHSTSSQSNEFRSTFLVASVAISSPILLLNLLLRHPVEIPHDIFDTPPAPRSESILRYVPSIGSVSTSGEGYRRRGDTTLVTGRRTTGARLFIKSGNVDGKGYRTRFPRLLAPAPRLSILPVPSHDAKRLVPSQPGLNWHLVQGAAPVFLPSPAPTRVASHRRSSTQQPQYATQHLSHMAPPETICQTRTIPFHGH